MLVWNVDLEFHFMTSYFKCCNKFYSLSSETTKENLGIIVQYRVKMRLNISGPLGGELTAELPFTLTHPKPLENIEERRVN